jgi:ligand-binding SRPBCC domain-containing protein
MIVHNVTAELEVPLPVERVFPFFAEANNLERITPPELRFRIISDTPVHIKHGTLIHYQLSLYGISFRWISHIAKWEPGRSFVDEQVTGPYRLWHHTHEFEPIPRGTRIRDTVNYAIPFSPFSELGFPIVRWQLRKIFSFRQRHVITLFGLSENHCPWHVTV